MARLTREPRLQQATVYHGLGFVLVAIRSKVLAIHNKWAHRWAHRLVRLDLPKVRETCASLSYRS